MKRRWHVLQNEPLWVPIEEVVSANQEAFNSTGEPFQLRDRGLLESALASCRNHFFYAGEHNILVLAVQLLVAIAQNHPFAQGNKRTGFLAALMFIETNGYECNVEDSSDFADLIIAVIEHKADKAELLDKLKRSTRRSVSKTSASKL